MSEFEELLIKIASVLEKLYIPYIVTGGAAVVLWGKPRFTADIDIALKLKETKIVPLVAELRKTLGETAYIDEHMIRTEQARKGEFNIIQPESGLKVDFFIKGDDAFEKKRIERGVTKKIGNQDVRFISPEDLILIKLLWYRESESTRHLEDIRSILTIQGENLDYLYLEQWAKRQGVGEVLEKLRKEE